MYRKDSAGIADRNNYYYKRYLYVFNSQLIPHSVDLELPLPDQFRSGDVMSLTLCKRFHIVYNRILIPRDLKLYLF